MRSTFRLLFYVNRQKIKANGCCPIMGRITVDGKVSQYSTGLEVEPDNWNAATGRAKENKDINRKLNTLTANARQAYLYQVDTNGYVSAEIIKNSVTGKLRTNETLLSLFDEHNAESAKRAGIDLAKQSYIRHKTTRRHIADFMKYKYDVADIALMAIDKQFIVDFEFYLTTILNLKTNSSNGYLNVLRKVIRLALKQYTIKSDPFAGYKSEKPPKSYRHLTAEQLRAIMQLELPNERLRYTRDMFLFSCFTGLGQGDLSKLTNEHIIADDNGEKWIKIERSKTGVESVIKLLDIPQRILERYPNGFIVPCPKVLAERLGEIAKQAGLDVYLTFYMARHTFATTVALDNGVPIETISKMLGHTSIKTTQVYAEITNQKLAKDLTALAKTANSKYKLKDIQ